MPTFNTRYGDENLAPAFKPDLGEQEFIDPAENLPSAKSLPAWNDITNLKEWQASDDNKKSRVYQKYLKDISGTKEWHGMEQTDRANVIKRIWKDAGFYVTEPPPEKGFLEATGERMQDVITQVNEAPLKIYEAVKSGKPTVVPVTEAFQAIISPALLALAPIGAAFETAGSGVARKFTSPEKAEQIGKTVGDIAEMATPFIPLKAGKYAEALSMLGLGNIVKGITPEITFPKGVFKAKGDVTSRMGEKFNAISIDEAGKLLEKGDPKFVEELKSAVQEKGKTEAEHITRNLEGIVVGGTPKAERPQVINNIKELKPQINEVLEAKPKRKIDVSQMPYIEAGNKVKGTNQYVLKVMSPEGKEIGKTIGDNSPQGHAEALSGYSDLKSQPPSVEGVEGLPKKTSPLKTIEDVKELIAKKTKEYGSRNEFLASNEYKQLYPEIKKISDINKKEYVAKGEQALTESGVNIGAKVETLAGGFGGQTTVSGTVISKGGIPYVKLDSPQMTSAGLRKEVKWHKGWKSTEKPTVKEPFRENIFDEREGLYLDVEETLLKVPNEDNAVKSVWDKWNDADIPKWEGKEITKNELVEMWHKRKNKNIFDEPKVKAGEPTVKEPLTVEQGKILHNNEVVTPKETTNILNKASNKGVLKEQKSYLLSEIDKAIEKAPDVQEGFAENSIKIEVPNDGVFEILNSKESLSAFRERVKKGLKEGAGRLPKPAVRTDVTKPIPEWDKYLPEGDRPILKSEKGGEGIVKMHAGLPIEETSAEEIRKLTPFYSKLEKGIESHISKAKLSPDKPISPDAFNGIFKMQGITKDEIANTGIKEFLDNKKTSGQKVSPNEVLGHLKEQRTEFKDVVLGEEKTKGVAPTQFSQYQEPGGTNYREMFVTAPIMEGKFIIPEGWKIEKKSSKFWIYTNDFGQQGSGTPEEVMRTISGHVGRGWQDGHPQYSDIQNPIIRIRFNDRINNTGQKGLYIEEIQSPTTENIKKMPEWLSKRAYDIGIKRILKYAADNGYDFISWTSGEIQANRYDLSKQIDRIDWVEHKGALTVTPRIKGQGGTPETMIVTVKGDDYSKVEEMFGKEIAEKIKNRKGFDWEGGGERQGHLGQVDLKVGGEGLKSLYDKVLPKRFEEIAKGKVGETRISTAQKISDITFKKQYNNNWYSDDEIINIQQSRIDDKFRIYDYTTGLPKKIGKVSSLEEAKKLAINYINEIGGRTNSVPFIPVPKEAGKGYSMYAGLPLTDIPAGDIIKGTVAGTKLEDDTSVLYHPEPVNDAILWLYNKWKKGWTDYYNTLIKSSKSELTPEEQKQFEDEMIYMSMGMTATLPKLGKELFMGITNPNETTKIRKAITKVREVVEDSNIRIKKMIESGNFKVDEASNIYEKAKLYHGKIRTGLEKGKDEVVGIDKDILAASKKHGVDDTAFTGTLNKYLEAKHTPERVAALGKEATTIPSEYAERYVQSVELSKYGDDIKKISERILDLNRNTLDILKEGGVITRKTYDTLRNKYKYHVPLKRIMPDAVDDVGEVLLSPKGFDVKSTGLKRAKGSTELEVRDILTNVFENHTNAIMRAEKNIVDNATYKFFIDNKELLGDTWKLSAPKFSGVRKIKTPEGIKEIPIREFSNDPQVLTFFKDGKRLELKIDDKPLAAAIRGVNKYKLDRFTNFIGAYSRYVASMSTRYALEFPPVNKLRDLQESIIYLASKKEMGARGMARTLGNEAKFKSVNSIKDWMLGKDTDGARLYQQLLEDGGTTGGLTLSMRKPIEVNLAKIRATNRSMVRQGVKGLLDGLDHWNRIFEDSTRLSAYESALKQGLSRQRAAVMAKEVSIDFDKMGTGGPLINALYVFSNASIQGTAKMLKAFRDNPKVALATTLGTTTAVWNVYDWNDSVDPDWHNKVSKWDMLNGLPVVLPAGDGDFNYFTIPVGWGLKPIKVAAQKARELSDGKISKEDASNDIFTSVIEGYNPLGGTDIWQAITPTIADILMDIRANKSWTGRKIAPEPIDEFTPESQKYFPSLEKSAAGKTFIKGTEKLAEHGIEISPADINYAYNQLIGGAGRTASKTINTINSIAKGEIPDVKDIPFVSKFFRKISEEEIKAGGKDTKEEEKVLTEQARQREIDKRELRNDYEQLKKEGKIDKEVTKKYLKKMLRLQKLGQMEKDERLINKMGVENGVRARFILGKLNKIEEREDKKIFLNNLFEKKLINEQILSQIMILKQIQKEKEN